MGIDLLIFAGMAGLGFFFGSHREKKHYQDILRRESQMSHLPVRSESPKSRTTGELKLVYGSVVIASDYFKTLVAGLKTLVGGRLTSYESLLDRARREAVLRMKSQALGWNAEEIVEVQIHTTFIDQLGIEVSAVGTALKR